jgi:prophage regulatory protein
MISAAVPTGLAIKLLRLPEVCKVTGLSRAMIYRLQASQRFPQGVKITAHATGWVEEEVQSWLAYRIEQSRGQPSGAYPTKAQAAIPIGASFLPARNPSR